MEKLIILILLSSVPSVQLEIIEDTDVNFALNNEKRISLQSDNAIGSTSVTGNMTFITLRGTINGSNVTTSSGPGTAITFTMNLWDGFINTDLQKLKFEWTKNDLPLSYFNRTMQIYVQCTSSFQDPGYCISTVNFTDITIFDTGSYECKVIFGEMVFRFSPLYIRVFAKPDIILYSYYLERREAAEINYTCAITNYQYMDPAIQYEFDWRISGQIVNRSMIDIQQVSGWQEKLVTNIGSVFMKNVSCEIRGCRSCGIKSLKLNFMIDGDACEGEYLQGSYWSKTSQGETATVPCPIGYTSYAGYRSRMCHTNGTWSDPAMLCQKWIIYHLHSEYYSYLGYTSLDAKTTMLILEMIEQSIPKRWIGTTFEIKYQISTILHLIEHAGYKMIVMNDMNMMKEFLLDIFRIIDKLVVEQFHVGLMESYNWIDIGNSVYNIIYSLPMHTRRYMPTIEYNGSFADFYVINETLACTGHTIDVRIPHDENAKPIFHSSFTDCGVQLLLIKYKYIQHIHDTASLRQPVYGNWSIVSDVISLFEIPSVPDTNIGQQGQIRTLYFDISSDKTNYLMCTDLTRILWGIKASGCNTSIIRPNYVACDCEPKDFGMIAVVSTDDESSVPHRETSTPVPTTSTSTLPPELPTVKNITDVHSLLTALDTVEKIDATKDEHNSTISTSVKVDLLQQISVLNISYQSVDSVENVTDKFASVVDNLLDDTYEFKDIKTENVKQTASVIMSSVDNFGNNVLQSLKTNQQVTITKPNIVISIQKTEPKTIVFPDTTIIDTKGDDTKFTLPKETLNNLYKNENDTVGFTAVKYSTLGEALKSTDKNIQKDKRQTVNSAILSLTLQSKQKILNPPIELKFQHLKANLSNPICSFWNFTKSQWSSEGCNVTRMEQNVTTCSCNHLTNFAILMSPIDFSDVNEKPLDIITKVGCSISIGCAALTLVIYFIFWRYVRKSRQSVLLINMIIAMLIAYLLFLLGTDHSENQVACRVIAVLLHYFFLAMFCVMLTMGFDLILATVRVFEHTARNLQLLIFAWGLPAIIVGITLGATQLNGYGDGRFCWLTGAALYVFIAPVLAVIMVNTLFIILVMKKMHASQFKASQSVKKKIQNGVKNMSVLLPVLGLTWIFGILSIKRELIVFQYIFAVLNSLQGLSIFIVHCVRNRYVHEGFKQFRRRARSTTMTGTKYDVTNSRARTRTTSRSETSH